MEQKQVVDKTEIVHFAICQDGDTSVLKKQHVREVTGRGGIKFLYCEGVRLTLLPFSVWGCKG